MTETNNKWLKMIGIELVSILALVILGYLIGVLLIAIIVFFKLAAQNLFQLSLFNENIYFLAAMPGFSLSGLLIGIWRRKRLSAQISRWKEVSDYSSIIKNIIIGCLTAFILLAFVYLYSTITYQIFGENETLIARWAFTKNLGLCEKFYVLFAGCIVAPIAEELYFREVMFGSLFREGFYKTAYILSCLIFAAVHLDLIGIGAYLIYGIGLAFVYQKTRSLITPIVVHMTINLISLYLILFP